MDEKQSVIDKIVSMEWAMFIAVNEGEARAACQEDRVTFDGMREAQFDAWPLEAVKSYQDDLLNARQCGRNLVEEKYIHMMENTEPSRYAVLLARITVPSEAVRSLAREVADILLEQTRILFEDYPYVSGNGRPLYSALDYSDISVETYQFSELLTYSEKTLSTLSEHIKTLENSCTSLARVILENTVRFYGYESLDTAEKAAKERADKLGIQVSFGCCSCEECEV